MLLANETVAAHLETADMPSLYRVHEAPDPVRLLEFEAFLQSLGHRLDVPAGGAVHPRAFQQLADRIRGTPEERAVAFLMLRTMQKARYDAVNLGHFGLAAHTYTHFTSPIRRYPDLVVHRALKAVCNPDDRSGVRYGLDELEPMGQDLSRLEKRADESDRYVDTFLKCSYLRARLGQTFEGLVTTVVEYGCFVQLVDLAVDGLLRVETLRDDDYEMSDDGHAWVGRRTRRKLAIGARVRVIVVNANPVEGLIDLELDA